MEDKYEKIFNTLLEISVQESLLQEMKDMPSSEELNKIYVPSQKMEKRIRRIISREVLIKDTKETLIISGKIAAGFLALLTVSAMVLLSVEASRNYIFNTLVNWYDDHTSFEFKLNETSFGKYSYKYIPEGFTPSNVISDDNMYTSVFTNDAGVQIILQQYYAEQLSSFIDNEQNTHTVITINGSEAYLFQGKLSGESNILLWKVDNIVFQLTSSINKDQLILMAENILKN